MKIAKRLAGLLAAVLLSSALWGMEGTKRAKKGLGVSAFPSTLISLCFQYLDARDLSNAACVCTSWAKSAEEDRLWVPLGQCREKAVWAKGERCTWRQAVQRAELVGHILSMETWKRNQLEVAMSHDGFASLQQRLLENLQTILFEKMKPQIRGTNDFPLIPWAFHLIVNFIYYYSANDASTTLAVEEFLQEVVGTKTWNAIHPSTDRGWYEQRNSAGTTMTISINKAVKGMDKNSKHFSLYRLKVLYLLVQISQPEMFVHLEAAISRAKNQLGQANFLIPADKFLSSLATKTWDSKNNFAAKNPYYAMLKVLSEEFASFIEKRAEANEMRDDDDCGE